jgi:tetratricopeptide (TPR) repeat protein/energy-coupling factor transporter ATP-binding protein EcfA2
MNPFPGLRPFEPDEDHLFFGREKQIDEVLRKLRTNRFLLVTGTSGSGKSSLVRSGLIPSLYSGLMANTGSSWRVAIFRPGEDPIGNLAAALDEPDVLATGGASSPTNRMLVDVTLRRSTLGLIEAVRQARIPAQDNVLVVVDQFEELFRFRNSRAVENSKDEASAFVKLLLEAAQQNTVPVRIVLTMRADFIGDCMEFLSLPEALNTGQYLVPRMTRDQLRSAITGPVAVAGGNITPRLVSKLLNDCGDDPDQLPVLQHALMRTWEYWSRRHAEGEPIDLAHYEAVGGMREALSLHAEEAYRETDAIDPKITERLFKALTDASKEAKGVRRPTSIEDLGAICGCAENEIVSIVEIFRQPGRSFLMPPADTPLESGSVIDLSHESLMRCWTRLVRWTEEEKASTEEYLLVSQDARCFEEGTVGLWRPPELDIGLRWRADNHPTAAWARRIAPDFECAMRFLDASAAERDRLAAERKAHRKRMLALAWTVAGALAVLLIITGGMAFIAFRERSEAQKNLYLAKDTVDSLLSSAGNQAGQIAADSPDVEQFRRRLVEQAKQTYAKILARNSGPEFGEEMALVDMRLGDSNRLTGQTEQAIAQYKSAIERLQLLARSSSGNAKYRKELADAYHWLGETERASPKLRAEAEKSYNSALALEEQLPDNLENQLARARTHYSRGIVRQAGGRFNEAQADYKEAIRLLTPGSGSKPSYQQELARAKNNLAKLIFDAGLPGDARRLYDDAIALGENLTIKNPENRDYKFELAQYYDNSAILFQSRNQAAAALAHSEKAVALYHALTRPLPALMMHLGLLHDIRGRILESNNWTQAEAEYRRSIEAFRQAGMDDQNGDFHLWFGQALANLGHALEQRGNHKEAIELLREAITHHQAAGSNYDLAWDYYFLANAYRKSGSAAEARQAIADLSKTIPKVAQADQPELKQSLQEIDKN